MAPRADIEVFIHDGKIATERLPVNRHGGELVLLTTMW